MRDDASFEKVRNMRWRRTVALFVGGVNLFEDKNESKEAPQDEGSYHSLELIKSSKVPLWRWT